MRRGQLDHPINWMLILFAGAFFLLLFFTIARAMLTTNTSEAITLNTITTLVERTKANPETIFETSLPQLSTQCENGVLSIQSREQSRVFPAYALFAPEKLSGPTTVRSEEFKLYHPIMTMTVLLPHDTRYVLTGARQDIIDTLSTVPRLITTIDELPTKEFGYDRVIILAADEDPFRGLWETDAKELYGIYYDTAGTTFKFYEYDTGWEPVGSSYYPGGLSSGNSEFLLAAAASATKERYDCGLIVIEKQIFFLTQLLEERTKKLLQSNPPPICASAYQLALSAYDALQSTSIEYAEEQRRKLLRASKTLGDNGCPNI